MTAKAWWTSFSSFDMSASTVDACPVCVLFSNFFNWVCALVLIDGGASATCVCDLVLCYGDVVWNSVLCFLVRCLWFIFLIWSTLGTDGLDNWNTWGFGGVIDLVCHVFLLVYSSTFDIAGAAVVVVGDVVLDVFCFNARSVIWISCRISSPPFLFLKFFIALAQSDIAAITLSACLVVGRVISLWLKCMVSVKCSLLVDFMWHICLC